jgi:hypothetical protein
VTTDSSTVRQRGQRGQGRSGATAMRHVACTDYELPRSNPGLEARGLVKARGLGMLPVGPDGADRRGARSRSDVGQLGVLLFD